MVTAAAAPETKRTFKISAPMMFPTASSECPRLEAWMAVTSSGSDVPKATSVAPMMESGMDKRTAVSWTEGMRTLEDKITSVMATTSFKKIIQNGDSSYSVVSSIPASTSPGLERDQRMLK